MVGTGVMSSFGKRVSAVHLELQKMTLPPSPGLRLCRVRLVGGRVAEANEIVLEAIRALEVVVVLKLMRQLHKLIERTL